MTIMRWIHVTYVKVKGQWIFLYRAVDSKGNDIDFYLSKSRNCKAAKCFSKKTLRSFHISILFEITVNKNPAYSLVMRVLKIENEVLAVIRMRQMKYLDNIIEQNRHFTKGYIRTMLGLKYF